MYTFKVMIHPNNKQETKLRRTLNKVIECNNIVYDYLDRIMKNKEQFPKCSDVRKWFTIQKTIKDNEVIIKRKNLTKKEMREKHLDTLFYDVSNDALKQEIKDTYNAFIRFFKKLSKYPVRKDYSSYKKGFYVDPLKIEFTDKKVKLEKIANSQKKNRLVMNFISLAEKNRIPSNVKYYNPRIILEGRNFFIVVSVDDIFAPKKKKIELIDNIMGIDVNIKEIVTSDNDHYASMKDQQNYKKEIKKHKRIQRRLSKKYLIAIKNNKKLKETKNFIKLKEKQRKILKRLVHIQEQNMSETINKIISKAPSIICVETLNVKEMKEAYNEEKKKLKGTGEAPNKDKKRVARGIQAFPFRKFINMLESRVKKYSILLIYAAKNYASSKTCSICGFKKNDLTLRDRVFVCPKCGLKINRDYNAAINLKNYAINKA